MYDNLDITVGKDRAPDVNFMKDIPKYLTKFINSGNTEFGQYITGYLDDAKIKITDRYVKFYDSSICKYYLGDNFKTLSKGNTQRAIQKLSDQLHLPFDLGNITRIDFSTHVILNENEQLYLNYLGAAQYYDRLEQNNGLYYSNKLRQLLFYGKRYEQEIKKQPIPELYQDQNVLRYEMRFRKNLRKQFKVKELTANQLYDDTFYINLVKRWRNEYFSIQKINSRLMNLKPTGSKKELFESIALISLMELGQPQILKIIGEWQSISAITKKQAYDHRKAIKELFSKGVNEQGNELINELNQKIREASYNF